MPAAPHDDSTPSILRMTAPLVVSFVMRAAFTFVDTIYAAIIGDAAVAAIGLTVPFEFLMIAVWVGLSTGLTSALSRGMGSRQGGKLQQYMSACRVLVWLVSPVFLLLGIGIAFAPRFGLPLDVYEDFRVYGTILIAGSSLTTFWSILPDSMVKAHHDTRTTMWAGIASNVINLALNTIFVFVFHWGIFGIALSTVIGRLGGLVYASIRARAHERRREAAQTHTRPGLDPHPYRAILSLAVPSSLTFALMAAETAVINYLLASEEHAKQAIASYSIFYRVLLFAFNPLIAAGVALLPYAARRLGEGDVRGVRRALRQLGWASVAYCTLIVTPLLIPLAPAIAHALAETPLTTEYTTVLLRFVPLACLLGAPFLLCRPVFEAMQRGQPGLWMAFLRYLVLTPLAAWVGLRLAAAGGRPPLYGLAVALIVVGAVSSLVFIGWLRHALPPEPVCGDGQHGSD